MKAAVPKTGMKLRGRYMTYRIRAVGLNLVKGLLSVLPSRAMGSLPDLTSRPSRTMLVALREISVPSNVSSIASCKIQLLESRLMIVELSFKTRMTVDTTAKGPLVKTSTANCGRYVKANMPPMTPADTVMSWPSLDVKGFHSDRCERK